MSAPKKSRRTCIAHGPDYHFRGTWGGGVCHSRLLDRQCHPYCDTCAQWQRTAQPATEEASK